MRKHLGFSFDEWRNFDPRIKRMYREELNRDLNNIEPHRHVEIGATTAQGLANLGMSVRQI